MVMKRIIKNLVLLLVLVYSGLIAACGSGASSTTTQMPTLSSIELSSDNGRIMPVGYSYGLSAIGIYSDGSQSNLTEQVVLTSSESSVVGVRQTPLESSSVAYAKATGVASVTASFDGVSSNKVELGAINVQLTKITINSATPAMPQGYSSQFSATGTFDDGRNYTITRDVVWHSNDNLVASFLADSSLGAGVLKHYTLGNTGVYASSLGGVSSNQVQIYTTNSTLTKIVLSSAQTSLVKGMTTQVNAQGVFSDGRIVIITNDVVWSSSNSAVSINQQGLATGVSVGNSNISASANSLTSAPLVITVSNPTLQSITITTNNLSLAQGNTTQFSATGSYGDGSSKNITNSVVWSSSESSVSISATGLATASTLTTGSSSISASAAGINSNALSVTVTNATLVSIQLSPAESSIVQWTQIQMNAVGIYSDGTQQNLNNLVIWDNSTSAIIAVSNQGTVLALAPGAGSLVATLSGVSSNTALINVSAPVLQSILVSGVESGAQGLSTQLTALGNYDNNTQQNITNSVAWSSSNSNVVSVNSDGMASAVGVGSSQVSASLSNIDSNSLNMTVSSAVLESIVIRSLAPSDGVSVYYTGESVQLLATGTFSDGTTQDITSSVVWNTNPSGIVGVNSSGMASALTAGTTAITASLAGKVSNSINLTIENSYLVYVSAVVVGGQTTWSGTSTLDFLASAFYSNGSVIDVTTLSTWSSSNSSSITVSNGLTSGIVKAVSGTPAGTTSDIMATYQGMSSSSVTVTYLGS